MLEVRGNSDFLEKPRCAEVDAELGIQNLERNRAIVAQIVCLIHDRHTTASDLALDPVSAGQRGIELLSKLHGSAPKADPLKVLLALKKGQILYC